MLTLKGRAIANATVIISGGNLPEPLRAVTSDEGYYNFENLPVGQTYILEIVTKQQYAYNLPSQIVNLTENFTNTNFVAEQP